MAENQTRFRNVGALIDAVRFMADQERDLALVRYARSIRDDLGVDTGKAFRIAAANIEQAPAVHGPERAAPELAQRIRQLAFE